MTTSTTRTRKSETVRKLFEALAKNNPNPTTELIFKSPYELVVSVVLSAQATDKSVNKATAQLFALAPTPEKMLELGEERVTELIKTIGLYRSKAKHVVALSKMLLDQHHGQIPDDREALEALPGVGRKTANVVLNTAFGHPTIAVDTHVFRVAKRLGLSKGSTVMKVEADLLNVTPKEYLTNAHHWLILHGRYTCKAINPLCDSCVVRSLCPSVQIKPSGARN